MRYIKEFFKNVNKVGSIAPSSKFLGKKMLETINFSEAKCIVEFGPGNGIFTKQLLAKMNADCILIVFEVNPTFYSELKIKIKDKRVILINESAENLTETLINNGFKQVDYIVSSLPLSIIPNTVKTKILNCVTKNISLNGEFIQFQYSLGALKMLKSNFKTVDIDFTPINVPPAFVYRCKN